MSHQADRYRDLLADVRDEFPRFRIVCKDASVVQRAIHRTLIVLTFGRMRDYLDGYQTTIGATVYVTADWTDRDDDDRYVTLRHERVHLRQFARLTVPVMTLLYLLVPMPMGLSWWRARFEKQAYAETISAAAEVWGPDHVRDPAFRRHIVSQFTGPAYGWMWPFPRAMQRWYDRRLAEVTA